MKVSRLAFGLLFAAAIPAGAARADEGLWTFDNFPAAKVKAAYGVDITPAWLARVQAASVRLSSGCSASVVSAEGLTLTNDHCATDCVQALSPARATTRRQASWPPRRTDERRCPQLVAEVLTGVTDVTARMQGAGAGLSGAALVAAREAEQSRVEAEACGTDREAALRGGRRSTRAASSSSTATAATPTCGWCSRRATSAAFFGGDPDNFNFPRYDLDCAFLRLYEDGKPAATPAICAWTPRPPVAGEPVFAAGNPAGTFRDETLAQLEAQRDAGAAAEHGRARRAARADDPLRRGERRRTQRLIDEPLMDVENDYKVRSDASPRCDDAAFMTAKRADELDLRARGLARLRHQARRPRLGDPWTDMAKRAGRAAGRLRRLPPAGDRAGAAPTSSATPATWCAPRPNGRSLRRSGCPAMRDAQLPALQKAVLDPVPIEPALEQLLLEFWLSKTRERLGADDPASRVAAGRREPGGPVASASPPARGSPIRRCARRCGTAAPTAIAASDDPMIQFMRRIDPEARRIRTRLRGCATSVRPRAPPSAIAKARFAVLGDSVYPDGTLHPAALLRHGRRLDLARQDHGAVHHLRGPLRAAPPARRPIDLDPRWIAARPKLDPATIFDLSTTNDIIGGSSGSPVLDAHGDVIGAVFDGNIHAIGGDYGFDPAVYRAVSVSAQAIQEFAHQGVRRRCARA